jgi:uncharacterized membrane protein
MSITGLYNTAMHFDGSWFGLIFTLSFLVFFPAPFYIVAYICFRRRYRELYSVLGVIGAFVVFVMLMSLPRQLHLSSIILMVMHERCRGCLSWVFL